VAAASSGTAFERESIARRAGARLRELCDARSVSFVLVDLRHGLNAPTPRRQDSAGGSAGGGGAAGGGRPRSREDADAAAAEAEDAQTPASDRHFDPHRFLEAALHEVDACRPCFVGLVSHA